MIIKLIFIFTILLSSQLSARELDHSKIECRKLTQIFSHLGKDSTKALNTAGCVFSLKHGWHRPKDIVNEEVEITPGNDKRSTRYCRLKKVKTIYGKRWERADGCVWASEKGWY